MNKGVEKAFQIAEWIIRILEIGLAIFLVFGIFLEATLHAKWLWKVTYNDQSHAFDIFLDNVLMYIIGLEVAIMFVKRKANIMVDILIFAIAREMIIDTSKGMDFFFGALAILILYIVKCYGISCVLIPEYFRRSKKFPDEDPHAPETQISE